MKFIAVFFVFASCAFAEPKMPDSNITPGEANPVLTKDIICSKSFRTSRYRHVTQRMHRNVFTAYGLSWDKDHTCCEDDHLISLELGGSNSSKNRWPQPWSEAKMKDKAENWLHKQVCQDKISLLVAQRQISKNWYLIYLRMRDSHH